MLRLNPKGPDLWDTLLPDDLRELSEDLAHADELLRDPRFMKPFTKRFNERTGRPGVPIATYLRLMYLRRKHRLSYEALIEKVAGSIEWRTFCGIGCQDKPPGPGNLSRLTQKYGEETLQELYRLVDEDLEGWKIRRRRSADLPTLRTTPAPKRSALSRLGRRLASLPVIGRVVERARALVSTEARKVSSGRHPSPTLLRRVHGRIIRIIQDAKDRARRRAARIKDRRARREVQLALDLADRPDEKRL